MMAGYPRPRSRAAGALLLAALLAGCAGPATRPADQALLAKQAQRERTLAAHPSWSLQGRLAVSGHGDGGSGQLSWQQDPPRSRFEVRAPVSRQTWRLLIGPDGARIEGLDGGPRQGRDAAALLQREVGWQLPLAQLDDWVRGMRGPGRARIEFAADGLPAMIEQGGWRIEYRGWDRSQSPPLPSKVFASRGEQRVRLAIQRWQTGP